MVADGPGGRPQRSLRRSSGLDRQGAVWTGEELIIWDGSDPVTGALGDGARYDPVADTWTPLPTAGAPSASAAPIAVWTGKELLVWGGACSMIYPAGKPPTSCVDAARHDPVTNTWSAMRAGPSGVVGGGAAAVWTGTKMLVWGGFQGTILGESAIGGRGFLNGGLLYDPATDAWSTLPQRNPPAGRSDAAAFWTGDQLLIWGGWGGTYGRVPLGDGARYGPAAATWTPLPDAGAPSRRIDASAVWAGSQLLVWGGSSGDIAPAVSGDGARFTPPAVGAPAPYSHDDRYFPPTGFRIDDATFWNYFRRRGGVGTFGYPRSRTFVFLGLPTQFFQRRILQRFPDGSVHLFNLLDPGLPPPTEYTALAAAPVDPAILRLAPAPAGADYAPAVLAFIRAHAPDRLGGTPVDFYQTFLHTVSLSDAFPDGGDPALLPLLDLEIWGLPLGSPVTDPNNGNFAYLRWQRGIMHFDASCHCTQGALVADELRGLLTGPDPDAWPEGTGSASRFYRQYDPRRPQWVRDPATLPATDLTNAFTPE